MQKTIAILIITLVILSSCKSKYEDCTDQDYANCETEKPQTGRITILLSINQENPYVPVRLYEGNFENGRLVREDTIRMRTFNYFLTPEKDYSFKATYKDGTSTVLAINGGRIKVSTYRMCELRCYEVNNLEIDLRLH
ncbi:MAG: hypothetical protein K0B37_04050 [Bacteroidales bacterium]|nr:hypothetical protein [Bacteroidales bacterium]